MSPMKCDRCGRETNATIMSWFNRQTICVSRCARAERLHPQFAEAQAVENEAVAAGEYNYPGIGLPADLVGGGHHLLPAERNSA